MATLGTKSDPSPGKLPSSSTVQRSRPFFDLSISKFPAQIPRDQNRGACDPLEFELQYVQVKVYSYVCIKDFSLFSYLLSKELPFHHGLRCNTGVVAAG